jgi:hypothetical protein
VHAPKQKPCTFWLKGHCTRGESCNFLHAHTTAPDVEMKTQLVGHEKAIRAIVLPEGHTQLYTGSQDGSVRVWDCGTGQCTSVVPMGGDVGALIYAAGWLFVGLPNEVKVRVKVPSLVRGWGGFRRIRDVGGLGWGGEWRGLREDGCMLRKEGHRSFLGFCVMLPWVFDGCAD